MRQNGNVLSLESGYISVYYTDFCVFLLCVCFYFSQLEILVIRSKSKWLQAHGTMLKFTSSQRNIKSNNNQIFNSDQQRGKNLKEL